MFRILKNGDRLAITIAEKKLAIERTKELILYLEVFSIDYYLAFGHVWLCTN